MSSRWLRTAEAPGRREHVRQALGLLLEILDALGNLIEYAELGLELPGLRESGEDFLVVVERLVAHLHEIGFLGRDHEAPVLLELLLGALPPALELGLARQHFRRQQGGNLGRRSAVPRRSGAGSNAAAPPDLRLPAS